MRPFFVFVFFLDSWSLWVSVAAHVQLSGLTTHLSRKKSNCVQFELYGLSQLITINMLLNT
jgi:hypothetical protein